MSDQRDPGAGAPTGTGEPDILAELEAEIAQELAEERPPAGGPAYQVVGALVALALGLGGAVLAYGYGLGSLREPGPGLWPFLVSLVLVGLSVALLVVGRHLTDSEAFTRSSLQPAVGLLTFVGLARAACPSSASRSRRCCCAPSGCGSSAVRAGGAPR